jgi:aminoglycoside phosphotransferase (APT) family kinase protein
VAEAPETIKMTRSSRDPEQARASLEKWLAGKLDDGSEPTVSDLGGTETNGMSSDTMLFRAQWSAADGDHDERLVARVAPVLADVPVFPKYDLQGQFDVISGVAEVTDAPIPRPWWCENSSDIMGAPFFVMSRVDGVVPPDVMPYTFGDNWLYDASRDDQLKLQTSTVAQIAKLHEIGNPVERFSFLEKDAPGDSHLRRHINSAKDWYQLAVNDGIRSPAIERAFDWLEDNYPEQESEPLLSWGDSRIGNVLYEDFEPVALLDWEMAALGPAELDIAWITYAHHVFETLAQVFELPGMPHFMRPEDVATQYESIRGYTPRNLRFYLLYCAVQWGVVFLRTSQRQLHFGDIEPTADPEEWIRNKQDLDSLLSEFASL